MKSLEKLKEIKKKCEMKQKNLNENSAEYLKLTQTIASLDKQIDDEYYDAYGTAVSGEDGYLGDGVYD